MNDGFTYQAWNQILSVKLNVPEKMSSKDWLPKFIYISCNEPNKLIFNE